MRLREALFNGLPVDDVPNGLEVLGLAVLVLEANTCQHPVHSYPTTVDLLVGVLPGVNTEEGLELTNDRVLVLLCVSHFILLYFPVLFGDLQRRCGR